MMRRPPEPVIRAEPLYRLAPVTRYPCSVLLAIS